MHLADAFIQSDLVHLGYKYFFVSMCVPWALNLRWEFHLSSGSCLKSQLLAFCFLFPWKPCCSVNHQQTGQSTAVSLRKNVHTLSPSPMFLCCIIIYLAILTRFSVLFLSKTCCWQKQSIISDLSAICE